MAIKKISIAILILLGLIFMSIFFVQEKIENYLTISRIDKTMLFTVSAGSNFYLLGDQLEEQAIVNDLTWWKIVAKLHPEFTKIKSGTYQFQEGANLEDMFTILNQGIEYQFKVTFVEGSTFREWLATLANAEALAPLVNSEKEILQQLGSPHSKLEGLLLPETYHYHAQMSAFKIIERAYLQQLQTLDALWAERDKNLPLKTPYEVLILASIIEKESSISVDRDKIASVFINRLRKGIRLQTDPTVIYGMGDNYQGRIRTKDLREKTAYNTYRINGLPPTPICMPSEAALYATLHPAKTDYLYFVSKGDGSSYFSKNLVEHNRAVQKYILGK
jgi:UPF0755 protein